MQLESRETDFMYISLQNFWKHQAEEHPGKQVDRDVRKANSQRQFPPLPIAPGTLL